MPDDLLVSLKDIAKVHGAWLDIHEEDMKKKSIADLISQGDRIQLSDKRFSRELAPGFTQIEAIAEMACPGTLTE